MRVFKAIGHLIQTKIDNVIIDFNLGIHFSVPTTRYWLPWLRLRWVLRDYPPYDPPVKKGVLEMSVDEQQANFDYFMDVKAARRVAFLKRIKKFGLGEIISEHNIDDWEVWFEKYGGLLPDGDILYSRSIFLDFKDRKTGARISFSDEYIKYAFIIDLAAFIGDYIIQRRDDLDWGVYKNDFAKNGDIRAFWGHPDLLFDKKYSGKDLLVWVINNCCLYWGEIRGNPSLFFGPQAMKSLLHLYVGHIIAAEIDHV